MCKFCVIKCVVIQVKGRTASHLENCALQALTCAQPIAERSSYPGFLHWFLYLTATPEISISWCYALCVPIRWQNYWSVDFKIRVILPLSIYKISVILTNLTKVPRKPKVSLISEDLLWAGPGLFLGQGEHDFYSHKGYAHVSLYIWPCTYHVIEC